MSRIKRWAASGFLIFVLAGLSASGVRGEPYIMIPGELRNVWIEVSEREGGSFAIDTATSWMEMSDGTAYTSETSAIISGTRVYAPVNGTSWAVGSEYHLFIKYGTDQTNEVMIESVQIQVQEGYQ